MVDRAATNVRYWDFFLLARASLPGTARPASSTALLDEVFRVGRMDGVSNAPDDLAHEMGCLHGRAKGASGVCPPAYYAARAAVYVVFRTTMPDPFAPLVVTCPADGYSNACMDITAVGFHGLFLSWANYRYSTQQTPFGRSCPFGCTADDGLVIHEK